MRQRRRQFDFRERLDATLARLEVHPPFQPIVSEMRSVLAFPGIDEKQLQQVAEVCLWSLKRLPSEQDVASDRFLFDYCLIHEVGAGWTDSGLAVPAMIYPAYEQPWSYQRVPLGHPSMTRNACVDVIRFPGEAFRSEVHLLEYPWLLHELAHSAFKAHTEVFLGATADVCASAVTRRRARSISLHGDAQRKARELSDLMATYWGPHADRNHWALELACDLFATWTTGPAYLAAFLDYVSSPNVELFEIDSRHPPYVVRLQLLEQVGRRLGWQHEADLITKLLESHSRQREAWATVANLADDDLVLELSSSLLTCLNESHIPRCTPADVHRAERRITDPNLSEFGIGLLLDAYVAHQSMSDDAFDQWHTTVVELLSESIRL